MLSAVQTVPGQDAAPPALPMPATEPTMDTGQPETAATTEIPEGEMSQPDAEQAGDAPTTAASEAETSVIAEPTDSGTNIEAAELLLRRSQAQQRFLEFYDDGNYPQSVIAANQVLQLTREAFGSDSIQTASPLTNLARAQHQLGDLEAARVNYNTAILTIEEHEGILSQRLINPLIGLGAVYNQAENYELGLRSYQRALRVNHVNGGFYNLEQLPVRDGLTESYIGLDDMTVRGAGDHHAAQERPESEG